MWMRDIELEAYGLLEYFPVRITSGDTGYMKPHPAIFQHALDLLGVPADEAAYVGDRPANDIAGANAVGMFSILMSPPHLERELGDAVPDVTIGSLSELLDLVDGW
jgi:putative hydrolase of the HAD superfamily